MTRKYLAIVDYGLGNLFSIKNACDVVGISNVITSDKEEITSADGVILPGVGAFNDAMKVLELKDLIDPLHQIVRQNKPLIGICLGMQLLMSESYEFGYHEGLGFINGSVVRLEESNNNQSHFKIPQIGWNKIFRYNSQLPHSQQAEGTIHDFWDTSPLEGIADGEFMYFVHSYYVKPEDPGLIMAITHYGNNVFCSAIRKRNIFGMQFHPERSGPCGLKIYKNIANIIS